MNDDTNSLMQQSLKNIGVDLICDSSATFKANVERSFLNAQRLFPLLFFKNKINDLNSIFQSHDWLVDEYNKCYNKKPINDNLFSDIKKAMVDGFICPKQKCKIHNGMYIFFQGKYLTVISENQKRMLLKPGGYINVHINIQTQELFTVYNQKNATL